MAKYRVVDISEFAENVRGLCGAKNVALGEHIGEVVEREIIRRAKARQLDKHHDKTMSIIGLEDIKLITGGVLFYYGFKDNQSRLILNGLTNIYL